MTEHNTYNGKKRVKRTLLIQRETYEREGQRRVSVKSVSWKEGILVEKLNRWGVMEMIILTEDLY